MASAQATTAAALPSLTELGLLGHHQPAWTTSWWLPSLPDSPRKACDRGRSSSRDSSPARKRPARSKERDRTAGLLASGPLPAPIALQKQTQPPSTRPKGPRDRPQKPQYDREDEECHDSNEHQQHPYNHNMPSALHPPAWPRMLLLDRPEGSEEQHICKAGQTRDDDWEGTWGNGRDDDGNSPSRPRLLFQWPLTRRRSKRKREGSPKPSEQEDHGLGGQTQPPPPPPPPPLLSELYVLYKFDRVDQLGGRRRGNRR